MNSKHLSNLHFLFVIFSLLFLGLQLCHQHQTSVQDFFPSVNNSPLPDFCSVKSPNEPEFQNFSPNPSSQQTPSKDLPLYSFQIDINTADWTALILLPGIGETLAKRIVDYRTNTQPFYAKEDICNIKGIGDKKYEKIAPYIFCSNQE